MGNLFFDIEKEKEKEFDTIKFRNQRRNLRQLKQVGRSNASIDSKRDALLAGKRISKNGNTYWETRKNRSDAKDSNI